MNDGDVDRNQIVFSDAGTLNAGGSISGGTITASTGTVNFNGSIAQSIPSYAFYNLTVSGTGAKTLGGGRVITGNLLVDAGATLSLGGSNLTIDVNADRTATINGTLNIDGNGRLLESQGSTKTLVLGPDGYLDITDNGGSALPALNAYSFNTTSTVEFGSTDAQTVSNTPTYGNLTLSGSGTKTFGSAITIANTLSIASGVIADIGTSTHSAKILTLNGVIQPTGSHGSTTSAATYQNNTYFAATTGIINVSNSETFTTSSSIFTVPDGVNSITAQAWGGGGAGGGRDNSGSGGAGGGGGGAFASSVVSVNPGDELTVNVAQTKTGLSGNTNGPDGDPSLVTDDMSNILVQAAGGTGGSGGAGGSGGTGGTEVGSIGEIKNAGGNGAAGISGGTNNSGAGGGGAGTTGDGGNASGTTAGTGTTVGGGIGGTGLTTSGNGNAGSSFGGGGSGARRAIGGPYTGGSGAPGQIIISWTICPIYSLTSTTATPVCEGGGSASTVTLTNSTPVNLPTGTYTVTYNLSAPNAATGSTATMTVSVAGTGTFTTSILANSGTTTVTITNLASGSCSNAISANNTANIVSYGSGTWIGATSTDWNTASNWCGGVPTATTDVVILSGTANQPTIGVSGGLCRDITINAGATLTISGSNTLTVHGDWTSNGTFTPNTSTVIFNGTTQAINSTTSFRNLTIKNTSTTTANSAVTINNAAGIFTVENGGTYVHNNTGTPSSTIFAGVESFGASSSVRIDNWASAATVLTTGVTLPFGNLELNWNPGGTWSQVLTGSITLTAGNFTITTLGSNELRLTSATTGTALTLGIGGNLSVASGVLALVGGGSNGSKVCTVNVTGNVSISGTGVIDMSSTQTTSGAVTLNVGGNFSVSGSGLLRSTTGSGTRTVNFNNASGIQSFTSTTGGINTNAITFNVGTGSSTNTLQLLSNFVMNNTASLNVLNNATLDCGTNIVQATVANTQGNFSLNSGGTMKIASTAGITSSGATGNIQTATTRSFSTTANYIYNGTAAQNTGNGLPATVNNLTFDNTVDAVTLNSARTITNTFSITSGSVANLGTFTHSAKILTINSVVQLTGSHGSTTSSATYTNNTYFAATTGIINVSNTESFTSSSTFTVPDGVTSIIVQAWGGGGGGGAVNGGSGEKAAGGGKGGSFVRTTAFTVIPGQMYTVTVGAAGAAGTTGSVNGGAGGTSSFADHGVNIIAAGGNGGFGVSATTGDAAGQTGTNGTNTFTGVTQDISANGGNGSGGSSVSDYSGGGGSSAGPVSPFNGNPASNQTGGDGDPVGGGDGGNGQSGAGVGAGSGGDTPGGAGGGARTLTSNDYGGGPGTTGQVIISWGIPTCPSYTATIAGTTTICTGGSANLTVTISGGNDPYTVVYTDGMGNTATVTNYASGSNIAVSPASTSTYTLVSVTDDDGCTATNAGSAVITVVADPTAPTLNVATPTNGSTVCVGQDVSATITAGTGGTGCTDEYQFSINSGGAYSAYTPGAAIPTTGLAGQTVIIQTRRVCSGNGCDGAGETYGTIASWTVVADPTAPTLNVATPANGSTVCVGQDVSATITAGTGGTGCTDEYQFSINSGGAYSAYTPGAAISTTGLAGQTVIIQTRRVCSGNGCDGAGETYGTIASWNIVALPAAVIASGAGTFCGSTTITASNGGDGTIYFQGTTSGGTSTATPSTSEVVTTSDTYYFRARSADGCWGTEGSVTVTINPLPTAGTCNLVGDLCQTNTGTIDIKASGGTPPYSVTWTPAHGMSQPQPITNSGDMITITGLHGGVTYTFVVKDANNCQAP